MQNTAESRFVVVFERLPVGSLLCNNNNRVVNTRGTRYAIGYFELYLLQNFPAYLGDRGDRCDRWDC